MVAVMAAPVVAIDFGSGCKKGLSEENGGPCSTKMSTMSALWHYDADAVVTCNRGKG